MMNMKSSLPQILIISLLLRVIPIIVLSLFENIQKGQLYLTDIDYKVYSDSTQYPTPYGRHTYRYTPLLSYIMSFNYNFAQCIGKLIFTLFDVFAVYFLWKIIAKDSSLIQDNKQKNKIIKHANFIAKLYGFNPLFIILTVRGSCQSIAMALMYAFWYFIFGKNATGNLVPQQIKSLKIQQFQPKPMRRIYAYLLYGLWVHFRVYPIIFLPLILVYEYRSCINQSKAKFFNRFLTMGLIAGGVFLFLLLVFYSIYGEQFINQSYLYHFTRRDNRHSFSPFFYDIYLNFTQAKPIRSLPVLCMIFFLTQTFSKKYSIFYMQFLMTFGFVEFNSVITLQYYMWVWGSMLLVLPESRILTFNQLKKGFNLTIQWFLGIFLWIWMSLKLQNDGQNIMTAMWVICLVKILLDLWVLLSFMKTVKVQNAQQLKKINLEQAKNILMNKNKTN